MWNGNEECPCKEGWGGINCNGMYDTSKFYSEANSRLPLVCETDEACTNFPLPGGDASLPSDDDNGPLNMTCYKGGDVVFTNHQMCDVTSVLTTSSIHASDSTLSKYLDVGIIAMLPDRPPQVTFSCDRSQATCLFQFWVDRVESFHCGLDTCTSKVDATTDPKTTSYECENIKCSCIPGRFICGEDGSLGE